MAFWKSQPSKPSKPGEATPATADGTTAPNAGGLVTATTHTPLPVAELRRAVDPTALGFKTTTELEPARGLIGQDRALKAIQFGANMGSHDFNIFVLGPAASGKTTAVRQHLERKVKDQPTPPDWVYVNNFETPNRPLALSLPTGRARALVKGMIGAIDELRNTLPAIFEGEEYQARRRSIEEEFRSGQEQAFEALNAKANTQNITILRTPTGFAMAPMHEGKIVKPDVFNTLPEAMRKQVEQRIEALQKELETIIERMPKSDKQRRAKLSELNEEVAALAVHEALDDIAAAFSDLPAVLSYLDAVGRDLVRNVGLFLAPAGEENELVRQPADTARDVRFRRYMVNPMVSRTSDDASGAPLVEELNPTYGNLIGRVEHIAQMGALVTDFLLIKPGSLHKANGGYLMIDVRKLLMSPFAWEALKRAIKGREIRIEQPSEMNGLMSTQSLDPEPIPFETKVVLLGDRELYYLLAANDPDFSRFFKVQADFDNSIERSTENDQAYARLIASIVEEHKLKPLDAPAVARVIEEGARLAADREKLSIEVGRVADLVREADYWSSQAGRSVTTRQDITQAIDESIQRSDRLRDRAQETIERQIVLVDTTGAKVGPDQRPRRPPTRRFRVRPAEPHHRARAHGLRPRHRYRARGEARRRAAHQGRDDPVGIPRGTLRARRAAGTRRDAGVRAVLRRRRWRQRVVRRTLRADLGARRSPDPAIVRRHRLRQPMGRGAGHRRRQREDRRLLRRLQDPRPRRAAGRAGAARQRPAPDVARGCRRGGEGRQVRHPRRRDDRSGHRDFDRDQGGHPWR